VVGGGLVGLTAALVLRHHGLAVTVVERRASTSAQPKARRFHVRTMEIFRELGLAGLVTDAARDLAGHDHMAKGHTLADAVQLPLWQPADGAGDEEVSPELPCLIAQDTLEPVLRAAAVDAGADVRFDTELLGFEQTGDEVVGRLRDQDIRARYLVAADGARSGIREALGIRRSGRGAIGEPSVNVYFRADLGDVVRGREFNLCLLDAGALASVDGRLRWVMFATGDSTGSTGSTDSTDSTGSTERDWPSVVRAALGVPAPDLEILSVLPWQAEMLVADRYSAGRVHLAGDAAHVMPPFAAAGANTGIADVHNLGWKLAAVLRGEADERLLDSYDAERRPAGWFAADQSARMAESFNGTTADPTLAHPYVLATGGFQYTGGALVPDGSVEPVTEFAPAGRVGTRVPHRWLAAHGPALSTLDLAGPGWAVLDEADFLAAGERALLRPDHVVAWRGTTDPEEVRKALLGGRTPVGEGVSG
jgi:2-polyprenyl-6-methoxyphenol hydroxylase-like FAD-dependent oxidoreductase